MAGSSNGIARKAYFILDIDIETSWQVKAKRIGKIHVHIVRAWWYRNRVDQWIGSRGSVGLEHLGVLKTEKEGKERRSDFSLVVKVGIVSPFNALCINVVAPTTVDSDRMENGGENWCLCG